MDGWCGYYMNACIVVYKHMLLAIWVSEWESEWEKMWSRTRQGLDNKQIKTEIIQINTEITIHK